MTFRKVLQVLLFFGVCLAFTGLSTTTAQNEDYTIPADPPDLDLSQVIATVGEQTITLGQFRERVRFERWRYYRTVLLTIERNQIVPDPGQPLIFPDAILAFVDIMGNPNLFGPTVYDRLVLEALFQQEAAERGLSIDDCAVTAAWAQTLGLEAVTDCEVSDAFTQEKAEFLTEAARYTGISEATIEQIIHRRLEIEAVRATFADDFVAPEVPFIQTRHIRVSSQQTADAIRSRLDAGESFGAVMRETTEDSLVGNDGDTLALATGGRESGFYPQGRMLAPIDRAVFPSSVGDIIGPVVFGQHFLIIEVQSVTTRPVQGDPLSAALQAHRNASEARMVARYELDLPDFQAAYVPDDPLPGVVDDLLLPLDDVYSIENPS